MAALLILNTASADAKDTNRRVLLVPSDVAPMTPPSVPASSTAPCEPVKFPIVFGQTGSDVQFNQIEVTSSDLIVAAGFIDNGTNKYPLIYESKEKQAWYFTDFPGEVFV